MGIEMDIKIDMKTFVIAIIGRRQVLSPMVEVMSLYASRL